MINQIIERRACGNCHYVGQPNMPGAGWIELVLWLCYLVPGLIYSIWRRGAVRRTVCPQCGAPNMLRLSTPKGREIAQQGATEIGVLEEAPGKWVHVGKPAPFAGEAKWLLLFVALVMVSQALIFTFWPQEPGGGLPLALWGSIALTFGIRHFYKNRKPASKS